MIDLVMDGPVFYSLSLSPYIYIHMYMNLWI
jgi:hypothetical protein